MYSQKPSPFIRGKIHLYQPKNGYRFNIDSVLLSSFFKATKRGKLIDLGTGVGILILLISLKYKDIKFSAVEVQDELFEIAKKNFDINKLKVELKKADIKYIKKFFPTQSFDYVMTNPPYLKEYKTENQSLKIAKSEELATLEEFISSASYLLKNRGRFFIVLPISRFSESITLVKRYRLQPKRLRFIHPIIYENATHFLLEAQKSVKEGGEIVEKPFIIYENSKDKKYTKEVEFILETFREENP